MYERDGKIHEYSTKSPEVAFLCNADAHLLYAINTVGNLKYKLHDDPYVFLVETIVGQMLSNKVADVITERLVALCHGSISISEISVLQIDSLREIGISRAKAEYILSFTEYVESHAALFESLKDLSDAEVMKTLMEIRGIGSWSAKMYLIFVLDRKDILPYEDGAFKQAFCWLYRVQNVSNSEIEQICKCWRPYTSLAARYLYRLLDSGATKEPSPAI